MIVLHDHKLIFLKPRKVAGTSFEIALSKFSQNPADIITPITKDDEAFRQSLNYTSAQNYTQPFRQAALAALKSGNPRRVFDKTPRFWNHMPATKVRDLLGSEIFEGYTKVTLYRRPLDRLVSSFYWKQSRKSHNLPFDRYCYEQGVWAENYQQYFIGTELVIDHLIRFSDLQSDILKLEDKIPGLKGLYETFSQIKTKSKSRPKGATPADMLAQYPSVAPLADSYQRYETETILAKSTK